MNTKNITKAITAIFAVTLLLSGQPALARGGGGGFGGGFGGHGGDFGGFGGHFDGGAAHFDNGAWGNHGTISSESGNRYADVQRDGDGNDITRNNINNINGYDHNHPLYPNNGYWNNHWNHWNYPYRYGYGYMGIPGVYYAGGPDVIYDDDYDYTQPTIQQDISNDADATQQPQQAQAQQMQADGNGNGQLRAAARQYLQNMAAQRNPNN